MKKIVTILTLAALAMASCAFEAKTPRFGFSTTHSTALTQDVPIEHYYAGGCWDEPYHYVPEWCDWYDDGSTCCVWYVDDWFEEYCQWGSDICWEYNGSF